MGGSRDHGIDVHLGHAHHIALAADDGNLVQDHAVIDDAVGLIVVEAKFDELGHLVEVAVVDGLPSIHRVKGTLGIHDNADIFQRLLGYLQLRRVGLLGFGAFIRHRGFRWRLGCLGGFLCHDGRFLNVVGPHHHGGADFLVKARHAAFDAGIIEIFQGTFIDHIVGSPEATLFFIDIVWGNFIRERAENFFDLFVFHDLHKNLGHVPGSGRTVGAGQAMDVAEFRGGTANVFDPLVHELGKVHLVSRHIVRKTDGCVVGAVEEHDVEQGFHAHLLIPAEVVVQTGAIVVDIPSQGHDFV